MLAHQKRLSSSTPTTAMPTRRSCLKKVSVTTMSGSGAATNAMKAYPTNETHKKTSRSNDGDSVGNVDQHASLDIDDYVNHNFGARHSSQTVSTWMLSHNMSRLNTAYKYLTPIIDDIISMATSYTHNEFKELLSERKPICSISYTQYIRAYQASEIITQVNKDLCSIHEGVFPQDGFVVNNVATIKREELLENIERMADRIFIDRDLMKQLVDLHELITDTIKKLKVNIDQLSIEGIPRDATNQNQRELMVDSANAIFVDKSLVRKEMAENFIILGEPKNRVCMFQESVQTTVTLGRDDDDLFADGVSMRPSVRIGNESVMQQHITPMNVDNSNTIPTKTKTKKKRKSSTKEKEKENVSKIKLEDELEAGPPKHKRKSSKTSSQPDYKSIKLSIRDVLPGNKVGGHTNHDPNLLCATNSEAKRFNPKELEDIVKKRASYTVGIRDEQPKCKNGVGKTCAVIPIDQHHGNPLSYTSQVYGMESAPVVVANSDTDESITNKTVAIEADCTEECTVNGEASCASQLKDLKDMLGKMGEQIDEMRENGYIDDIDDGTTLFSGKYGMQNEKRVLVQAGQCLEQFVMIREKFTKLNFAEVAAEMPEASGCCYREYGHVHIKVMGLPVTVKITQELLEIIKAQCDGTAVIKPGDAPLPQSPPSTPYSMLSNPPSPSSVKEAEATAPAPAPAPKNQPSAPVAKSAPKACECKRTLRKMLQEKCAIARLMKRNEPGNRDKIVMMSMDPITDTAYSEHPPEVFNVLDMQDSNTSLPYVVNRHSLPNITVCDSMNVSITQLRSKMRNENIEHPKQRIERELQQIGIENLIKASLPAHCCKRVVINSHEKDAEPFHASLNSLPLTSSDLALITEIAEQDATNGSLTRCNYRSTIYHYLTATINFKFESYTNFQENFASNYDYFVPKAVRVYQVFYFEIFKKEHGRGGVGGSGGGGGGGGGNANNTGGEVVVEGGREPAHVEQVHYVERHQQQQQHRPSPALPFFGHHKRTLSPEYHANETGHAPHHRNSSRSVLGDFFRRFIFNGEQIGGAEAFHAHGNDNESDHSDKRNDELHASRASKSKDRKSRHKTKERKRDERESREAKANHRESRARHRQHSMRNRRLQTSVGELDRFSRQAHTRPEDANELEDYHNSYGMNAIASSMKNYTVSNVATSRVKTRPPQRLRSTSNRAKLSTGVQARRVCNAATDCHKQVNKKTQHYNPFHEDCSETSRASTSHYENLLAATQPLPLAPPEHEACATTANATSRERSPQALSGTGLCLTMQVKDEKPNTNAKETSKEIVTKSSSNLGTIYETDEKDLTKRPPLNTYSKSSFYDFLRSPELYKSFQRFLNNESSFEKHAQRASARRMSRTSVNASPTSSDTDKAMHGGEPSATPAKRARAYASKIPKRVRAHTSPDSSSEMSLSTAGSSCREPPCSVSKTAFTNDLNALLATSESPLHRSITRATSSGSRARLIAAVAAASAAMRRDQQPESPAVAEAEAPGVAETSSARINFNDILEEAVRNHARDGVPSFNSLQMLAQRNGPGYVTVLHPECGCPEVSIFVPCYCGKEDGCQKRTSMSPQRVARLTARQDGRHIILPAKCRIPRREETESLASKIQDADSDSEELKKTKSLN